MKLLLEVSSLKQIKENITSVDGFIVGYDKFTSFSASTFSFENIAEAVNLILNLTGNANFPFYINLNQMLHEEDIDEFKKVVEKLSLLGLHFIVQDFGAALIIKEICGLDKTIFNPYTLITNSYDAKEYSELGFEAVIASSEILVSDLKTISEEVSNVGVVAFGYHPMYQTYRHIIDLYKENNKLSFDNENLTLREWTRDEYYHVLDNEAGSVIFRPYVLSLLKEYENLTSLKYMIINTIFFDDEQVKLVTDNFNEVRKNNLDVRKAALILDHHFEIEDGFMYQDSIYNPKEF